MTPEMTTLCYIEKDGAYLMLHRVKKEKDINKDKWIGIGGHMEDRESPEDCLVREAREETGLTLTGYRFRGLVTFLCGDTYEYMCLFTADAFTGEIGTCDEGTLEWVDKKEVYGLNLWAGDRLFLRLLEEESPFFSLKLVYTPEGVLSRAVLDGKPLELLDILDEDGKRVISVEERDTAHYLGLLHATVHIWIVRPDPSGGWEILCQKRSRTKDSNPGCWDISSAGHIGAGDTRENAVVRELEEELGLRRDIRDMEYIGFTRRKIDKPFYGKLWPDNQISHIYICRGDVDEKTLVLQESEVESVEWFMLDELIRRTKEGKDFPNCFNPEELEMLLSHLSQEERPAKDPRF